MNAAHRAWPIALLLSTHCLAAAPERQVADDTGATVVVDASACRIVSLAPGTTAMLYAAGAGSCLIGTIAHSNEPEQAAKLPVVGDAETFDFERLLAMRPTAAVVAVDVVQRVRIDRLRALGIPVYQVHVTRLDGMPESVRRLGALAGTEEAAGRAADALAMELESLRAKYQGRPPLSVLYQIWDKPIYTIGGRHVINDALRLCGARNVFDDLSTAAPSITRESVLARDPQLIIASAPAQPAKSWLEEWRRFASLSAVREGRLVAYSDERIDRMGPSVIAATALLCETVDSARNRSARK
jgi:iron complex transport system substrate-binding protein